MGFKNKRIVFLVFLLFFCRACLNPKENNGNCANCLPTQNLQNGSCYMKVRGCLVQKAQKCIQCQSGYILAQNLCILQAVYFNFTKLAPSPQQTSLSSINQSQITTVMIGGFNQTTNFSSPSYIQAKSTLFQQYPFISGFNIYKVQEQQGNGVNYIFYIINQDNYDLYLAKVFVSLQVQASVEEIYQNDINIKKGLPPQNQFLAPIPGGWQLFMNISDTRYIGSLIFLQNNFAWLNQYQLQRVEYHIVAGIVFRFFYNKDTQVNAFVAEVYQPFYGKPTVQHTWGDMPDDKLAQPESESNIQPIQISGGSQNLSNSTIQQPQSSKMDQVSNITQNQTNSAVSSSSQWLNTGTGINRNVSSQQYNSQQFLPIIQSIKKVIPNFDVKFITKVTQQTVAGYNFLVTFSFPNSTDSYQLKIYQPLPYTGQDPFVQSARLNGMPYDLESFSNDKNQIYSWQNDTVFPSLYKFFKKQVRAFNLLPISQVTRQQKQNNSINWLEYNITFSKIQYTICRYYLDYQIFEVVSYVIGGKQMYSIHSRVGYGIYDRAESVLVDKIKEFDFKSFNRILIKNITMVKLSDQYRIYQLDGYTVEGHFQIVLLDKGSLFVIQNNKLDQNTFFAINFTCQVHYKQEYIIDQIRAFMLAKYNLAGFQLTLALTNAYKSFVNQYLLLFVSENLKKIRVLVDECDGKFVIRKIDILNHGLVVVSDASLQKIIENNARNQYPVDLNGFQKVIIKSNGTLNVAKFANDSSMVTYGKLSTSKTGGLRVHQFTNSSPCLSVESLSSDTCSQCSENNFLWKGKCYGKISNCTIQIGSLCAVCDKFSIEFNGKCLSQCADVFSL